MKSFLIIFVLFLQGFSFSQGAFYYQKIEPYDNQIFGISECKKGFLAVGKSNGAYLLFLSNDGKPLWEKSIDLEIDSVDASEFRSVVFHKPYFYAGGFVKSNGYHYFLITKIGLNGEIIDNKVLNTPADLGYDNFLSKILVNKDGILIAGAGLTSVGTKGELLQIDFNGNILWHKFYSCFPNSIGHMEKFNNLKTINDSGYLLQLSTDEAYSTIIKTNVQGDELWRKSFDTIMPSDLTNDSLYFIAATPFKKYNILVLFNVRNSDQYNISNYPRNDFALIEYDKDGQELSYKRFYNPKALSLSDIFSNDNNEIFILGNSEYSSIIGYRLGTIKLNSKKEIEWKKFYKRENKLDTIQLASAGAFFNNGKLSSDGGTIMVGVDFYYEFGSNYYNSTILKLDCKGDTTWNYQSCLSPKFDDLTIFPNPFSNSITVQIPNIPDKNILEVKIYDVVGRLIYSFQYENKKVIQINSSSWADGVYNCVFNVNGEYLATKKIIKGSN